MTLQICNHAVCSKSNTAQIRYSVFSVLHLPLGERRTHFVTVYSVSVNLCKGIEFN